MPEERKEAEKKPESRNPQNKKTPENPSQKKKDHRKLHQKKKPKPPVTGSPSKEGGALPAPLPAAARRADAPEAFREKGNEETCRQTATQRSSQLLKSH